MKRINEEQLVKKIKSLCADGKEESDKLRESGNIFHQLGVLFKRKGCEGKTKKEKFYLIQSAALYNAAITRLPSSRDKIDKDLNALWKGILLAAEAKDENADLFSITERIKNKIKRMRLWTKTKLRNLLLSPKAKEKNESKDYNEEKINKIKSIQAKITKKYTKIMADISNICQHIMGASPCAFSVVGMGSLARKEITPYSDFEHMILLQEGEVSQLQSTLRYFRWFTIIFHVIIITLKETPIHLLAIPSLKWFKDVYTKSGICFDGMMPYASHFPLGRLATSEKRWDIELIKSPSNMVEYLQSQFTIKDGYNLADVISKPCFVSGDDYIYKKYIAAIKDHPFFTGTSDQNGDYYEELRSSVQRNLVRFDAMKSFLSLHEQSFHVKAVYRSTTLFISALGRHESLDQIPCFEIIEKLKSKNYFADKIEATRLSYAVAIACEVRLRSYMENESNFDDAEKDLSGELIDHVGLKNILNYLEIAFDLQKRIESIFKISLKHEGSSLTFKLAILYKRDRHDQLWKTFLDVLKEDNSKRSYLRLLQHISGFMSMLLSLFICMCECFELLFAFIMWGGPNFLGNILNVIYFVILMLYSCPAFYATLRMHIPISLSVLVVALLTKYARLDTRMLDLFFCISMLFYFNHCKLHQKFEIVCCLILNVGLLFYDQLYITRILWIKVLEFSYTLTLNLQLNSNKRYLWTKSFRKAAYLKAARKIVFLLLYILIWLSAYGNETLTLILANDHFFSWSEKDKVCSALNKTEIYNFSKCSTDNLAANCISPCESHLLFLTSSIVDLRAYNLRGLLIWC